MGAVSEVRIGSRDTYLLLTVGEGGTSGRERLQAELRSEGLSAAFLVRSESGFADLLDFFEALTRDRRGWDGERVWESLDGELRIGARHTPRDVLVRIALRQLGADGRPGGWRVQADVPLDLGEELSGVLDDLRVVLA